jgi:hypothetical protein
MSRSSTLLTWFLIVLVVFSFLGCASGPRGKLRRVKDPTDDGLRQKWNEYTVYYRRNLALIYKIKNDSKIELDGSWIEVTSDNMMKNTRILNSTWVNEIIGENEKMFGYLVWSEEDNVYVGIVDANTVKLIYYYAGSLGGGP